MAAPRAGFLSVWDLQDDGRLQAWLEPVAAEAKTPATGAVLLDDYPGAERVFFLWTEVEPADGLVRRTVERAFDTPIADLEELPGLGEGTLQRSVLLLKVSE